jgi:hypothetical protein
MKRTLIALFTALIFTCSPLAADQVEFQLTGNAGNGLLPGNVTPPTASTGSGGILTNILFDLDTSLLYIDIGWGSENGFSDLTGEITMLHLHGPTPDPAPLSFSETGDLLINLALSLSFNSSPSGGGIDDFFFINNSDVQALLEGRFYINVHTAMYTMGEIRGYLVPVSSPVPEPGSVAMFACLTLSAATVRRRRATLQN